MRFSKIHLLLAAMALISSTGANAAPVYGREALQQATKQLGSLTRLGYVNGSDQKCNLVFTRGSKAGPLLGGYSLKAGDRSVTFQFFGDTTSAPAILSGHFISEGMDMRTRETPDWAAVRIISRDGELTCQFPQHRGFVPLDPKRKYRCKRAQRSVIVDIAAKTVGNTQASSIEKDRDSITFYRRTVYRSMFRPHYQLSLSEQSLYFMDDSTDEWKWFGECEVIE